MNALAKGFITTLRLVLCLVLSACGGGMDEDERIFRWIDHIAEYVEDESMVDIMAILSPDFTDMEGRSKSEVGEVVATYLDHHSAIVMHVLGKKMVERFSDKARLEVEISLSSGAAETFRKLIRYYGETYRFDLELGRGVGGEWQITRASWRYVTLEELFPESFRILKKVFPNI